MLVTQLKKTDHNTKVTEIENKLTNHNLDKYIDNQEFNKLSTDVFNARLAQAKLITKTEFDSKLSSRNRKITQNKTKYLLVENALNKIKTFDLGYFIGRSHFEEDGTQNYLVFQPIVRYFKVVTGTNYISSLQLIMFKGLSAEGIKPPITSDNSLTPELNYYDDFTVRGKFSRSCLKQPKFTYTHKTKVNIYFVSELVASTSNNNDPTLKNYLFRAVTLTKNTDIDKYGYSSYGIGFDRRSSFSFRSGGFGQNILIFGVDMSSSAHVDNKKKDILVLGKGPT